MAHRNGHHHLVTDQRVLDALSGIASIVTALKDHGQWIKSVDYRLKNLEQTLEVSTSRARKNQEQTHRLSPIDAPHSRPTVSPRPSSSAAVPSAHRRQLVNAEDPDSSHDPTPQALQPEPSSPKASPPDSAALAATSEPKEPDSRSASRPPLLNSSHDTGSRGTSSAIPYSPAAELNSAGIQSTAPRPSGPFSENPASAGAPLSHAAHTRSQEQSQSVPNGHSPIVSRPRGGKDIPSSRVSNALSVTPLETPNNHISAASTTEPQNSTPIEVTPPQTSDSRTVVTNGVSTNGENLQQTAHISLPAPDPARAPNGLIPNWLPLDDAGSTGDGGHESGERMSHKSKSALAPNDKSPVPQEHEPESDGDGLIMQFSANDYGQTVIPATPGTPNWALSDAENSDAANACIIDHSPEDEAPQPSADVLTSHDRPENRSTEDPLRVDGNRSQWTGSWNPNTHDRFKLEPEIIVISDDDGPIPIRDESARRIPDVKEEPGASESDGVVNERPESPVVGKRRRTSMPFTNSISRREQRFSYAAGEHNESSDDDSEESFVGRDENYVFQGSNNSPDAELEVAYSQRPLKIPRLESPLTDAEAAMRVQQADGIRKTFFVENGGNPAFAVELYTSAANRNNVTAMVRLADILEKGAVSLNPRATRVRRNSKAAQKWVNQALRLNPNCEEALILRGDMCVETRKRNRQKCVKQAMEFYDRAEAMGSVDAICRKGHLWYMEMTRATTIARERKCCESAMRELEAAVEGGSARAASLLGAIYENPGQSEVVTSVTGKALRGEDVEGKAVSLYFLSKERGSAHGTNDVAACYEVAYGSLLANFDQARMLYEQSFRMGYLGAAANLAMLYEYGGQGDDKLQRINHDEAFRWFNYGHFMKCPVSSFNLGQAYEQGTLNQQRDIDLAERMFVAAKNYAEDTNTALDIKERAVAELFAIRVTKLLLVSEGAEQARKDIISSFGKTKGLSKVESVREDLTTCILAQMNPCDGSHEYIVHLTNARSRAEEALNPRNFPVVMRRSKIYLNEIRAFRKNEMNVARSIELLAAIVGERGLSKLGIQV